MNRFLLFFLCVLSSGCITPGTWKRHVPKAFFSLAVKALAGEDGNNGHLARYAVVERRSGQFRINCWDLVRIPKVSGNPFPLPVAGTVSLFAYSAEKNTIRQLSSGKTGYLQGEKIIRIPSDALYPDRYLVIHRMYTNTRSGLIKAVQGGSTLYSGFLLKGFQGKPKLLLPEGYRSRSTISGDRIHIAIRSRKGRRSRISGYLLLTRRGGPMYRKYFFPKLHRFGRGGGRRVSEAVKLREMKIRFQRVCREADGFSESFFPGGGGRAGLAARLLQEADACGVKGSLVLPLDKKGNILPLPGVRIRFRRRTLWLFPVDRTSGAGSIPEELRGRQALLISRKSTRRLRIPRGRRDGDYISIWSSIRAGRSGGGSVYFTWRMTGAAAATGRAITGLAPAMKEGKAALSAMFLPAEHMDMAWIRMKHRVPTHHPFQGKARGWISGVLRYKRGAVVAGLSFIRRKFGRLADAWRNRSEVFPLFSRIWAFREKVVVRLPRGVYPYRLPRRIRIRRGGVLYTASWRYLAGPQYRKPRRWSWRRWSRWRRTHYIRGRGKLVLSRIFRLRNAPVGIKGERNLLRILSGIDRWDEREVRMRWR